MDSLSKKLEHVVSEWPDRMSKKSCAEKYNIRPDAPPLIDLSWDGSWPDKLHTRKLKTTPSLGRGGARGWIRYFRIKKYQLRALLAAATQRETVAGETAGDRGNNHLPSSNSYVYEAGFSEKSWGGQGNCIN